MVWEGRESLAGPYDAIPGWVRQVSQSFQVSLSF